MYVSTFLNRKYGQAAINYTALIPLNQIQK